MARPTQICLVDDLLREQYVWARGFIYTAIEEPIRQAGILSPDTRHFPHERGLSEGFDERSFKALCGSADWTKHHNAVPRAAEDYLISHIPSGTLVLGYEMPPWLLRMLERRMIPYVAIRISPIRFARDLYLIIQSNIPGAHERISHLGVSDADVRIEAGLLRASARQKPVRKRVEKHLANSTLFVGQTRRDASLTADDGRILTIDDFRQQILDAGSHRRFCYKPHPYDGRFAREEHRNLEKLLGRKVPVIKGNIYQLMASTVDFDLMTISSGTTQEAPYFNRVGKTLHRHVCNPHSEQSSRVGFLDLCSPQLWALLIGLDASGLASSSLSRVSDNLMRRLHDAWWGYSEYMIDSDQFWQQVLTRGARNLIEGRITKFLRALTPVRSP